MLKFSGYPYQAEIRNWKWGRRDTPEGAMLLHGHWTNCWSILLRDDRHLPLLTHAQGAELPDAQTIVSFGARHSAEPAAKCHPEGWWHTLTLARYAILIPYQSILWLAFHPQL